MASVNDTPLAQLLTIGPLPPSPQLTLFTPRPQPPSRPTAPTLDHCITVREIAWLAGLLEGEGSFGLRTTRGNGHDFYYPQVTLEMTDLDVVTKVQTLLDAPSVTSRQPRKTNHNPTYVCALYGTRAVALMMTILPFMGARRSHRIQQCLADWKHRYKLSPITPTHCPHGHLFTTHTPGYDKQGWRYCKTCASIRARAKRARRSPDWTPQPRPPKTHCIHGHLYTTENTYTRPDGERQCRTCRHAQRDSIEQRYGTAPRRKYVRER